ncbi:RWP-RK domain-containing 5 [Hibiscus trionum]|uniref:RWP-RK domain-containing 5 n=1 Tax=Hibiscus trionum TaxID=183268 RepID=A0A9W7GZB3_HIBTR|nr:RWP-RK domain-containing 5 [Hibiscus trionum]
MDLSQTPCLTTLLVFENTINKELIRSLHVYRLENGEENEVEREFVFRKDGPYVETAAAPLLLLQGFSPQEVFEGRVIGLWLCSFAFHARRLPRFFFIPSLLSITRNPKLKSIPTLANDLQMIFQRGCGAEDRRPSKEACIKQGDNHCHPKGNLLVLDQDLNCLPNSVAASELQKSQQTEQNATGVAVKKKKRADSKDVARIALEDLAKYFDLPIVEASRNLNVGLTVLKRKCREFGIPRWPHRKIKSLDGLIRDLQEEAEQRQQEDEAAAYAVAKRRMMLETEKESIEREPCIELKNETKRFRQDIFKRRHKARALKNQYLSVFHDQMTELDD